MTRPRLDDPTLVDSAEARTRSKRSRRGALSRLVPGAWSALSALAILCFFVLLAPAEAAPSKASLLGAGFGPLALLSAAATLGALACLSGIRRLWTGNAPVRGALGVALGSCPAWIAVSLLLLRALGSFS